MTAQAGARHDIEDVKRSQPDWISAISVAELEEDPNPVYDRLRAERPVAFIPAIGTWMVSTRELCQRIANDTENFRGGVTPSVLRTFEGEPILSAEGEHHKDLRAMVDPALRPREVDRYIDGLVRPTARHYLEKFEDRGTVDLVENYFEPISVRTLGDMLGFRKVSSHTLRTWFKNLSNSVANQAVDQYGNFLHPEGFAPADASKAEIRAIVDPMMARLAEHPDESGISHWMHDGMPDGQVRSPDYIYPTLFTIILGGMQEPGHACSAAMYGLLTRPEQLDRVLNDPNLIPQAINEGIRWITPIWSAIARIAKRDLDFAGVRFREGDIVMMSYGSANRDTTTWDAPDVFDLDRPPAPHLAFGAGPHACAGAYQAQNTARIALEELLDSIPNLELDERYDVPIWGWDFRGLSSLHVKWEA
jgi:aromatic O-demethylase, cytochrome P450 subunit